LTLRAKGDGSAHVCAAQTQFIPAAPQHRWGGAPASRHSPINNFWTRS